MSERLKQAIQSLVNGFGYEIKRLRPAPAEAPVPQDETLSTTSRLHGPTGECRFPATEALYARLTPEAHSAFDAFLANRADLADSLKDVPREQRVRETLRLGNYYLKDVFNPLTGLTPFNPPDNVHAMVREEVYCGDVYYCDLISELIENSGHSFKDGGAYLDFGSSSGRVVRSLALAYPQSHFYGCDPNRDAIAWASGFIPNVRFFVSPEAPPMDMPDNTLDGAYAISIWSHFSARAALAWLDEMHRVLKEDGFLVITTHGFGSLRHYLKHGFMLAGDIEAARRGLENDGHYFIDVFRESGGDWGVGEVDWGNSFFNPIYLIQHLSPNWVLQDFRPSRSEDNQDVYLLRKARRPATAAAV
jgi:SAM-dependent methyltransferase